MGKILIIGASGQVGGALRERLGGDRTLSTFRTTPLPGGIRLELLDLDDALGRLASVLDREPVEAVVIAAAMTNVDLCEAREDEARLVNRDAPGRIAALARSAGARTVYLSSEYVFDGEAGPYSEEDVAEPISVYGRTKLEGEAAVTAGDPSALVLRTTVVYGPEEQGKNFAYRLTSELSAGRRLVAPFDQLSSPTYNRDLAEATVALLSSGALGLYHVVGPETMDRVSFARRLASAVGLDAGLVDGIATSELDQPAKRPLTCGLRILKLRSALPALDMRSVEAAVDHWTLNPRGKPWPTS